MLTITAEDSIPADPALLTWLREHDIEPNGTYKVEVGGDVITVYQYARNENGAFYLNEACDGPARLPRFHVRLKRPFPV